MKIRLFQKCKKMICMAAALCMIASMAFSTCAETFTDGTVKIMTLAESDIPASSAFVKYLGRTYYSANMLILANSGSGCEFRFYGNKASITFAGDETTEEGSVDPDSQARIAIYINGECKIDTMIDQVEKTIDLGLDVVPADYEVKVVKLSESLESMTAIKSIHLNSAEKAKPTANQKYLVEFVGDSITCGYGLDDPDPAHTFRTATENITKSYAALTAQNLGMDYSVLAFSGYGVLLGNMVRSGKHAPMPKTISQYYNDVSYSRGTIADIHIQEKPWEFHRAADVVVVNIGTNDYQYIRSGQRSTEDFKKEYIELLNTIWTYNPNANIICTLGMMGKELCPTVQEIVNELHEGPGRKNIYYMEYDEAAKEDGLAAQGHPSAATHAKAAEKLSAKIREVMGF